VVVERVLRPGAMLRCKQELSMAVRCVAAGGRLGNAWRPEAKHCRRQEAKQRNMCARKKKRGRGSGGPIWKSQKNFKDLSVN
jgi:hypothetical protein